MWPKYHKNGGFSMKKKLLGVALISLLMAGGLFIFGCNLKQCPGDGTCAGNFTGTGPSLIVNSRTGCGDNSCSVFDVTAAMDGYNFDMTCGGCQK